MNPESERVQTSKWHTKPLTQSQFRGTEKGVGFFMSRCPIQWQVARVGCPYWLGIELPLAVWDIWTWGVPVFQSFIVMWHTKFLHGQSLKRCMQHPQSVLPHSSTSGPCKDTMCRPWELSAALQPCFSVATHGPCFWLLKAHPQGQLLSTSCSFQHPSQLTARTALLDLSIILEA